MDCLLKKIMDKCCINYYNWLNKATLFKQFKIKPAVSYKDHLKMRKNAKYYSIKRCRIFKGTGKFMVLYRKVTRFITDISYIHFIEYLV